MWEISRCGAELWGAGINCGVLAMRVQINYGGELLPFWLARCQTGQPSSEREQRFRFTWIAECSLVWRRKRLYTNEHLLLRGEESEAVWTQDSLLCMYVDWIKAGFLKGEMNCMGEVWKREFRAEVKESWGRREMCWFYSGRVSKQQILMPCLIVKQKNFSANAFPSCNNLKIEANL